ncbi:hypothetical protein DPV78_007405, partial [Talaromyces pinophilus]
KIEQLFIDRHHVKTAYYIQNAIKLAEFFYRNKSSQVSWIDKLVNIELKTMGLVQDEVTTAEIAQNLEKFKKLEGNLIDEDEKILQEARGKLKRYDICWWSNTCLYYRAVFHKSKACYIWQLDLLRNEHFRLTEEYTRSACKVLGGCCAYDCGCCYQDRGSSRMPGVLMHCMIKCCCWWRRRRERACDWNVEKYKNALRVVLVDYWHRSGIRK